MLNTAKIMLKMSKFFDIIQPLLLGNFEHLAKNVFCNYSIIYTKHNKRQFIRLKTCVRNFSLFLKEKCVSALFRTKYIEKKFVLQLFYLPIVS